MKNNIVKIDIASKGKLIKNVPHIVIPSLISKNEPEYRFSLNTTYEIAAIFEYMEENLLSEYDFHDVKDNIDIQEKLKRAKYYKW